MEAAHESPEPERRKEPETRPERGGPPGDGGCGRTGTAAAGFPGADEESQEPGRVLGRLRRRRRRRRRPGKRRVGFGR